MKTFKEFMSEMKYASSDRESENVEDRRKDKPLSAAEMGGSDAALMPASNEDLEKEKKYYESHPKEKKKMEEISSKGRKEISDAFQKATNRGWSTEVHKEEVEHLEEKSPVWTRKEGQRESGGLNEKGVKAYRRAHPGSKLKTAVTTEPSKLKKGGKAAKRRKSFCARMKGMKKKLTSAKTAHDPDSRINKSLRKWNC